MRALDAVLANKETYKNKVSAKYTADGKLDAGELDMLFKALLTNQACLALGIRDVYQALSRVEQQLKQMGRGGGRGPAGSG